MHTEAQTSTPVPEAEAAVTQAAGQLVEEKFGMRQVKDARRRLIREAGLYAAAHPEESFASIARRFGMSESSASSAARSVGLMPRKRGRKPAAEATTEKP